ncbi:MAG: bifunctional metallophosphatase/5'-nucleotidase [Firmicutes bacterium]|nr:bifunctional metallophosphatase/5'-nucleotidase [Bacillota bacterium]
MSDIKKLTILHSNDMHGAFLPEMKDGKETGGLTRLSGYVSKVRSEEENVIYAVAGDMFRGSIIDAEYQGQSTIDLMNMLAPDVVTLGNHEADYGMGHLLFLEKCAKFPIINANLFVTMNNARLFQPYLNIDVADGMRVLFIGILTEDVLASAKTEKLIGTFIDVEEVAKEVGVICDNYRNTGTDLTVLLTHIGIEADRELAKLLDPDWGVDLIIGGHTHTFMEEPEIVNGVPIVQAGTGTSIIGRLDLEVDCDANEIASLKWQCVPINEDTAPKDAIMEELLDSYRTQTDTKYKRVVTRWARKLTHPRREQETEMGNLYADALAWDASFDLMILGSGSIRKTELGPIIEYQDMLENTPFDDALYMLEVTGDQLKRMVQYVLRDEAWEGHTEFYQFSKGFHVKYRKSTRTIEEFTWQGKEIAPDDRLKIALQNYHYKNFDEFFHVPLEEVKQNMRPRVVATSVNNIYEEYFSTNDRLDAHVEGRIEIVE